MDKYKNVATQCVLKVLEMEAAGCEHVSDMVKACECFIAGSFPPRPAQLSEAEKVAIQSAIERISERATEVDPVWMYEIVYAKLIKAREVVAAYEKEGGK